MKFYLAHPFDARKMVREMELRLEGVFGVDLLNPFYDTGRGDVPAIDAGKQLESKVNFKQVVEGDIADIRRCDALVAVLCHAHSIGTIMEIVYAKMAGKRVVVLDLANRGEHPWILYHADEIYYRWDYLGGRLRELSTGTEYQ